MSGEAVIRHRNELHPALWCRACNDEVRPGWLDYAALSEESPVPEPDQCPDCPRCDACGELLSQHEGDDQGDLTPERVVRVRAQWVNGQLRRAECYAPACWAEMQAAGDEREAVKRDAARAQSEAA